ncbi:MAG TPA: arylamine N-acetyltransferase [Devosiaceae bacterium]|nr:arylamine N-acetyltransferase [Devosiaceae bacterium]
MSEEVRLNAYFERIGFAGSIAPTAETLAALHALQPAAIPFENLDGLLGRPVLLDQASLDRKLLGGRRGGYCFELNMLFLRVLRELGFESRGHLARVLSGGSGGARSRPDHMLVTVDVDGTNYLADVGFSGPLQTAPLRLRPGEQEALLGTYRLSGEGPAMLLEFRRHGGEWRRLYEFSLEEVDAGSCAAASDELNADPQWFLRRNLLVERTNPRGRWQLFNGRLRTDTAEAGEAREIGSVAGLREVLAETFGVDLAGLDGLDETLAAILDRTDAD